MSVRGRRSATDEKTASQTNGTSDEPSVIADRLHIATGFLASERDWVVRRLGALGSRLRPFPDTELVSTSTARELALTLNEVRDDLIRQVDDAKTRTEPRNNR